MTKEAFSEYMKHLKNTRGRVLLRQSNTNGGGVLKYTTRYTRKSGDPQTTVGNTIINMFAHYRMYKKLKIYDDLIVAFCLGDDHFAIFSPNVRVDLEKG